MVYKSVLVTFSDRKITAIKITLQEGTNPKPSYQMETITAIAAQENQKKISVFFESQQKTCGSLCPVKDILHAVSDKWSILVMVQLGYHKTLRFNALKKSINGVSQKMLTVKVRQLESFGLVHRQLFPEIPPRVEYTITPLGEEFLGHLMLLLDWTCNNIGQITGAKNS